MKYFTLLVTTLLLTSCGSMRSGVLKLHRIDRSKSEIKSSQPDQKPYTLIETEAISTVATHSFSPLNTQIESANSPISEEFTPEYAAEDNSAETGRSRKSLHMKKVLSPSRFLPSRPKEWQKKKEEPVTPTIKSRAQIVWGVFGMLWAATVGVIGILLIGTMAFMFDGFLMVLMLILAATGFYFVLFGFVRYIAHMDTRVGQTQEGKTRKSFKIAGLIYLCILAIALLSPHNPPVPVR